MGCINQDAAIDALETAAIARYRELRAAFWPCWGVHAYKPMTQCNECQKVILVEDAVMIGKNSVQRILCKECHDPDRA